MPPSSLLSKTTYDYSQKSKSKCSVLSKEVSYDYFFHYISLTALLNLLLQMALLEFFILPPLAAACFEPTSVELHRDLGPFLEDVLPHELQRLGPTTTT